MSTIERVLENLHWLGHDAFRLEGRVTVYLDPYRLEEGQPEADVILISHEHGDHCSPEDVRQIRGPETAICASPGAARKLGGDVRVLRPGDAITVKGVDVEAVPAYNVHRFRSPGVPYHPEEEEHCGFVVTVDGVRVYFAGDTDHIEAMSDIDCDIALLPVSGTYVMDAEEAAEAAADIGPQVVVPMHWGGGVVGTRDDAERFADLYDGRVVILEKERGR